MGAHACILVFDVTRKITYKNLDAWYDELAAHRGHQVIFLFNTHCRSRLLLLQTKWTWIPTRLGSHLDL